MITAATITTTTTTTTATTAASTITKRKIIQLNYSEGNNNVTLSISPSSTDDESIYKIANNNQFHPASAETPQLSNNNSTIQLYHFTDKISPSHIEPIDINSSHTIEELDEKRENERVYEYLLRLTEVLIPDTVDIYEGRNIKTIFCLFALAKYLRRTRCGPSIRRGENIHFSHTEALKRLEYLLEGEEIPGVAEISVILDDLQQDDILRNAASLYAEELHKIRRAQSVPLSVEQIENLLKIVNTCMRVRFFIMENDECNMCEKLKCILFGMKTIVKNDLKEAYMKAIREKYDKVGKDHVSLREELRDIVEEVNDKVTKQQQVEKINMACKENDCSNLLIILHDLDDVQVEYISYCMYALKKYPTLTMKEVNEVIRRVSLNVINAVNKSRETLRLNMFLMNGKNDEAAKLLLISWRKIVRNLLIPQYLVRKKLSSQRNTDGEYLRERFQDGVLYINVDNEKVIYDKPKRIVEWMLTREEIE
ncbi:unnamed protein product, partial [Acanthocheilonema viteae]